jgi:hypothetical protein
MRRLRRLVAFFSTSPQHAFAKSVLPCLWTSVASFDSRRFLFNRGDRPSTQLPAPVESCAGPSSRLEEPSGSPPSVPPLCTITLFLLFLVPFPPFAHDANCPLPIGFAHALFLSSFCSLLPLYQLFLPLRPLLQPLSLLSVGTSRGRASASASQRCCRSTTTTPYCEEPAAVAVAAVAIDEEELQCR